MISRLSSLRGSLPPLFIQNNFFPQRNLSCLLPLLPFQAHANFKLSPRVISLLQNQVRTKVSQAYAKTLSKLLILPASPAYNEVIRRISFPERINIVDQMQNLSSRVQTRFIKSVTSGNWEEIQAISNYPSHALKALRENAISPEDFASVMFP